MTAPPISAVVLVGGQSRRFGRDKLLEPVGGKPLVSHAIDPLRASCGHVTAVGACDPRVAALADDVILDEAPGSGPLGAIVSALRQIQHDILVAPGDLLGLDETVIARLKAARRAAPETGVVVVTTDRPQWTLGIYQFLAVDRLAAATRSGESLGQAVQNSGVKMIEAPDVQIRNINHPNELDSRNRWSFFVWVASM